MKKHSDYGFWTGTRHLNDRTCHSAQQGLPGRLAHLGTGRGRAYSPPQSTHSTGRVVPAMSCCLVASSPAGNRQHPDRCGLTPESWPRGALRAPLPGPPAQPGPHTPPLTSTGRQAHLWGWTCAPPPPPKAPTGTCPPSP